MTADTIPDQTDAAPTEQYVLEIEAGNIYLSRPNNQDGSRYALAEHLTDEQIGQMVRALRDLG